MRTPSTLPAVALALAVLAAGPAPADTGQSPEAGDAAGTGALRGEHAMSGRVTSVDPNKGMVGLDTAAGKLDLHFPPQALQDLRAGDRITVHLGFTQDSSGGTHGAAGQEGTHR